MQREEVSPRGKGMCKTMIEEKFRMFIMFSLTTDRGREEAVEGAAQLQS